MKAIDDLITRLRGEMSSRIDDRDIVDILEVLQEADEYFEAITETSMLNGKLVVKYENVLKYYADRGFNKAREALED